MNLRELYFISINNHVMPRYKMEKWKRVPYSVLNSGADGKTDVPFLLNRHWQRPKLELVIAFK